jgi:diphthine synthase
MFSPPLYLAELRTRSERVKAPLENKYSSPQPRIQIDPTAHCEEQCEQLGELVFVGLGLHDESGLSLRGQAEARSCDLLFAEFYTSVMPKVDLTNLRMLVGKDVQILSRKEVEESVEAVILAKAKDKKVGFLVPGDPMVATTHVDLRLRAHKAGIKTRIIHAASVASAAAGVTGLQSYKFGRTVTVPASWQGGLPESVYMTIKSNRTSGLHSLVLLEVDIENNTHISIPAALKRLLDTSERRFENLIGPESLVVGVARIEAPDMVVKAGTVSEVMQIDFGEPPYVLIFPGQLHFVEAEALQLFCGASKELVNRAP